MPRAATTWLYHNLRTHPEFFLPFRKEPNYFSVNHRRGEDWYTRLFKERCTGQIPFDISPYYFIDPDSIPRMIEYDPEMKVILGLRDPASFAISFYSQHLNSGIDVPPFADYIEEVRLDVGGATLPMRLADGFLSRRLAEFREAFAERLLVYDFKGFRDDPLEVLRAIEAFAGVDSHYTVENFDAAVINAGNRKSSPVFNKLMRSEAFVGMVDFLFPRKFIQSVRHSLDRASKAQAGRSAADTEEHRRIAALAFAEDDRKFREFFDSARVRLGSGETLAGK